MGERSAPLFRSDRGRERYLREYDEILKTWPVPVRRNMISTRFGATHVIESGEPTADLVLLLPGSYGTALQWAGNVGALVDAGFRVASVDLINDVGRSVATRPARTAGDLAAWLDDLIAGIGGSPVHLVGMSYGGWVALNAALRLPHLLRSLVLIDPVGLAPLPTSFFLRALPLLVAPTRRITDRYLRWFLAPGAALPLPFARLWELGWKHARPGIAAAEPFTDAELGGIRTRTLILLGEHDPIYPHPRSLARVLSDRMPTAQALVIEAGHLGTVEQGPLVNRLLGSFLASVDPGPAGPCPLDPPETPAPDPGPFPSKVHR